MNDLGKKERLRNGEAVELKPGVFGRVNKDNRTLELDSGKVLPIGKEDQRDLFPSNAQSLDVSRRKEKLEGQIKKAPFGEFLHQFGQSGILSAPKDWLDYATKTGDQYLAQKQAQAEVSGRISKESPITSGLATAASFAPDIALTHGMSALRAAPLLTAASAGSRIVREPEEVATESLFAAGAGKLLDIGGNALNKIANRRAANRALPGQQLAVREANELQNQQFNFMKENVKNVNEARLQNHQNELNVRQNSMIQSQNQYEQAKIARDTEVIRLKNQAELAKAQRSADAVRLEGEYKTAKSAAEQENKRLSDEFKLAKNQYEESLKKLPELQKQAQAEYSANVVKNAEEIENAFPKGSKINSYELDIPGFLETKLSKSGLGGTPEASQVTKILKSLFSEGETLTSKEIANRYKAIENAIQRSNPEVKSILNDFKIHLGEKLPNILSNNMAYERVIPSFIKQLEKDIESTFKKFPSGLTFKSTKDLEVFAKNNAKKYFEKLTPSEFVEKIKSGEFRQELLDTLFSEGSKKIVNTEGKVIGVKNAPDYVKVLEDLFKNKLDPAIAKAELKMIAVETDASRRLGGKIKKTFGVAEPVIPSTPPSAPSPMVAPQPPSELPPIGPIKLPPPVQSPLTPPMPGKPTLAGIPQVPIPLAEPTLAPAQGLAERTGDLFEKDLLGGNTLTNNPLTKLAGLKYLLGSAALPAEAAYVGLNALTSPGAAGQAARMTFKQGGIQAIESWAQKYPSYHDGILENPQERRSLTKEIEDSYDIPIEQKAVIQSKINRGKPLQERL